MNKKFKNQIKNKSTALITLEVAAERTVSPGVIITPELVTTFGAVVDVPIPEVVRVPVEEAVDEDCDVVIAVVREAVVTAFVVANEVVSGAPVVQKKLLAFK